ncbi:hypothetical protein IKJ53_03085 [bacterium]|nr:hypothetical protein [bacterium]
MQNGILNLWGSIEGSEATVSVANGATLKLYSSSSIADTLYLSVSGILDLDTDFVVLDKHEISSSATVNMSSGNSLTYNVTSSNNAASLDLPNILGAGTLILSGKNYTINTISEDTKVELKSGTAKLTSSSIDNAKLSNYKLGSGSNGATLELKVSSSGNIGNSNGSQVFDPGTNNKNTFIIDGTNPANTFSLYDIASVGTVKIKNAVVKLNDEFYTNNSYAFDTVTLNLIDDTANTYTFNDLSFGTGTNLKMNLFISDDEADSKSDVLNIRTASGNINLTELNIMGAVTSDFKHNYEIITGSPGANLSIESSITDQELTFGLTPDNIIYDTSVIGVRTISSYIDMSGKVLGVTVDIDVKDALAAANQLEETVRHFYFSSDDSEYKLTSDTGVTAVNPDDNRGSLFINIRQPRTNVGFNADHRYSMFVLDSDNTTVGAKDVYFTNAVKKGGNASVFDVSKGTVTLENVVFTNNEQYAIYNIAGTVTLDGVKFTEYDNINNAIYNSGTMTISGKSELYSTIKNVGGTLTIDADINNSVIGKNNGGIQTVIENTNDGTATISKIKDIYSTILSNASTTTISNIGTIHSKVENIDSLVKISDVTNINAEINNDADSEMYLDKIGAIADTSVLYNYGELYINKNANISTPTDINAQIINSADALMQIAHANLNKELTVEGEMSLGPNVTTLKTITVNQMADLEILGLTMSSHNLVLKPDGFVDLVGTLNIDGNVNIDISTGATFKITGADAKISEDAASNLVWDIAGELILDGSKTFKMDDADSLGGTIVLLNGAVMEYCLNNTTPTSQSVFLSSSNFISSDTNSILKVIDTKLNQNNNSMSDFKAQYHQINGELESTTANLFAGQKVIDSTDGETAKVVISGLFEDGFNGFELKNNVDFTATVSSGTISKNVLSFSGMGSQAVINAMGSDVEYKIASDFSTKTDNSILIRDAKVILEGNGYNQTHFKFDNVVLELRDADARTETYNIYKMDIMNEQLGLIIDINLASKSADKLNISTLSLDSSNKKIFMIEDIILNNVPENTTASEPHYISVLQFKLPSGLGITSNNREDIFNYIELQISDEIKNKFPTSNPGADDDLRYDFDETWANQYEYVTGYFSKPDAKDFVSLSGSTVNILIKCIIDSYKDILNQVTILDTPGRLKTFYFDGDQDEQKYQMKQSLEPLKGMLLIKGNDTVGSSSNYFIDAKKQYSLFKFVNDPTNTQDLSIEYVTIQGAKGIDLDGNLVNGAVVSMNNSSNPNSKLTIKSSVIQAAVTEASMGGAIYQNHGSVSIARTNFSNNVVNALSGNAYGGAIYNSGNVSATLEMVDVKFIGNYVRYTEESSFGAGGAIFTKGDMTITSTPFQGVEFTGNYVEKPDGTQEKNAIFVQTTANSQPTIYLIGEGGMFTFNDSISGGDILSGTVGYDRQYNIAISGEGTLSFKNNITNANVFVNGTDSSLSIEFIKGADGFTYQYSNFDINGENNVTLKNISIKDASNTNKSAFRVNGGKLTIESVTFENNTKVGALVVENAEFIINKPINVFKNNASTGSGLKKGAAISIYNSTINNNFRTIWASFDGNYLKSTDGSALGGAIFIDGGEQNPHLMISANFIGNYAEVSPTTSYIALGGAIFTNKEITILADSSKQGSVLIQGNYTYNGGVKEYNAIFLANGATLNLSANVEGNAITIYDSIIAGTVGESPIGNVQAVSYESDNKSAINITGMGEASKINLYNKVVNSQINLSNASLIVDSNNVIGTEYGAGIDTSSFNFGQPGAENVNVADLFNTNNLSAYTVLNATSGSVYLKNLLINNAANVLKIADSVKTTIINSYVNARELDVAKFDEINLGILNSENTLYSIDFEFFENETKYDRFKIDSQSTGKVVLDVNWLGNIDYVRAGEYAVLTNESNLILELTEQSKKIWEYDIKQSTVNYDEYIGIKKADVRSNYIIINEEKKDTLQQIALYKSDNYDVSDPASNERFFKFEGPAQEKIYNLSSNIWNNELLPTGTLKIVGKDMVNNVIDGAYSVTDDNGNTVSGNYAMFYILNDSDNSAREVVIETENVTIRNIGAYTDSSSSVAYLDSNQATLKFKNVNFKDNLGYTFVNKLGRIEFDTVTFEQVTDGVTGVIGAFKNEANKVSEADSNNVELGIFAKQSTFKINIVNAGLLKSESSIFNANIDNSGTILFSGQGNLINTLDINNPISVSATTGSGVMILLPNSKLTIGEAVSINDNQKVTIQDSAELYLDGGTFNYNNNDTFMRGGKIIANLDRPSVINYDVTNGVKPVYDADGDLQFERGSFELNAGTLNIGVNQGATLYLTDSDSIASAVQINFNRADSALELYNRLEDARALSIDLGDAVDGGDSWEQGNILLFNSTLIMKEVTPDFDTPFVFDSQNLFGDDKSKFINENTQITIKTNQAGFLGEYIQRGADALLTVETSGTFWGSNETVTAKKSIQGGKVKVTVPTSLDLNPTIKNIELGSGTSLEIIASGGVIDSNIFKFANAADSAVAQFYFYGAPNNETYYTLYHINNSKDNTIIIGSEASNYKTNVRLGHSSNRFHFGDSSSGVTKYMFKNAVINLLNESTVFVSDPLNPTPLTDYNEYTFAYFDVDENTIIKMDLDLNNTDENAAISDTLNFVSQLEDENGAVITRDLNIEFNIIEPSKISNEKHRVIEI